MHCFFVNYCIKYGPWDLVFGTSLLIEYSPKRKRYSCHFHHITPEYGTIRRLLGFLYAGRADKKWSSKPRFRWFSNILCQNFMLRHFYYFIVLCCHNSQFNGLNFEHFWRFLLSTVSIDPIQKFLRFTLYIVKHSWENRKKEMSTKLWYSTIDRLFGNALAVSFFRRRTCLRSRP